MAAKMALRDTAKVLGLSVEEGKALTKQVPDRPGVTIAQALMESPDLVRMTQMNDDYRRVVEIAQKIEGLPRQTGIHACGLCIGKSEITDYCPTATVADAETGHRITTSQFEGPECEAVGLVKMDFLGLRTLDVIENGIRQINEDPVLLEKIQKEVLHEKRNIRQEDIPIEDLETYRFLAQGNTSGVFQFESSGMTGLVKKMFKDVLTSDKDIGEECFERLIAAVALYRPGPMDEIPHYLDAMGSGKIEYDHPLLEDILKSTYGILVYQEEIMFAVRKLAGFSAGQSDTIRKAMGKKKLDLMEEYGDYFIYGSEKYDKEHPDSAKHIIGCVNNGVSEETAKKIWDKMVKFASYAFNKSHATCYAALGARTAWLSCHFPVEYMTGVLNSYLTDNKKMARYVGACYSKKIPLLLPDVNLSDVGFRAVPLPTEQQTEEYKKGIIFGLSGINGVGAVAARSIVEERERNGEFRSVSDFLERMAENKLTKTSLQALILAGAFDRFPGTRRAKMACFDQMLNVIQAVKKIVKEQVSFFDIIGDDDHELQFPEMAEYSVSELSDYELEYLGYYIHHPISEYSGKLDRWEKKGMLIRIANVEQAMEMHPTLDVRIAGLVKNVEQKRYMKNGKPKSLLRFEMDDGTGTISCVAFDKAAVDMNNALIGHNVVYIHGQAKLDDFGLSCRVDDVYAFDKGDKNK